MQQMYRNKCQCSYVSSQISCPVWFQLQWDCCMILEGGAVKTETRLSPGSGSLVKKALSMAQGSWRATTTREKCFSEPLKQLTGGDQYHCWAHTLGMADILDADSYLSISPWRSLKNVVHYQSQWDGFAWQTLVAPIRTWMGVRSKSAVIWGPMIQC